MFGTTLTGYSVLVYVALGIFITPARGYVAHELSKIVATPPLLTDAMGSGVAIASDFLAVAAYGNSDFGIGTGAIYMFRRTAGGGWTQHAKLHASDAHSSHLFGWAIAIDSNWLFSATFDDNEVGYAAGAAYVFRRNDAGTPSNLADDTWIQSQKITAPDGYENQWFGYSVASWGDWVAIGAKRDDEGCGGECDSGAVYLYRRNDGGTPANLADDTWVFATKIHPAFLTDRKNFGTSVALHQGWLVVGAPGDYTPSQTGAAYVYRQNDNGTPSNLADDTWIEQAWIYPTDRNYEDLFGSSVAIYGDRILVGATGQDNGSCGTCNPGAAYIFHRDDNGTPQNLADDTWVQAQKLISWDGGNYDEMGNAVALTADYALVGAMFDRDVIYRAGAGYLYRLDTNNTDDWTDDQYRPSGKLMASDAAAADFLGRSVAMLGDEIVMGAEGDDNGATDTGAAYIFTVSQITHARRYDLDGDEFIGSGDLSLFAGSWLQAVPPANNLHDFDCDDLVGVGDLSWFATGWLKNVGDPSILDPPCPPPSLAVAAEAIDVDFELRVLANPSVNDLTNSLPPSIQAIGAGNIYYLEIWVSDVGSTNTGLTSAYVDVNVPPDAGSVQSISHGGVLTLFASGIAIPGGIDELGGSALPGDVGVTPQWVRVGYVRMQAKTDLTLPTFSLSPSTTGVAALGRGVIPWSASSLDSITVGEVLPPNNIVWKPSGRCTLTPFGPCTADAECPPGTPGLCKLWPNDDPEATTRSLRFSVAAPVTAGVPVSQDAIKVTMVDLQHPNPRNSPTSPPANYTTFDTRSNGVCTGGQYNGHHCDTDADCVGTTNGTCSSLFSCTAAGEGNSCARWVGKPGTFYESEGPPQTGPYRAARLQCTPFYWDWKSEGMITVVGAEIVPSSEYSVQDYAETCMGTEAFCGDVSSLVTMYTRRLGDVDVPYNPGSLPITNQPNAGDIAQLVNKFKNLAGAPVKARAQLQPNLPELNASINALDIVAVVDAFKGLAYAFSGPCPCPSTQACGLPCGGCAGMCVKTCTGGTNDGEPCIGAAHCPGGACGTVGTCRDKCGRCTP